MTDPINLTQLRATANKKRNDPNIELGPQPHRTTQPPPMTSTPHD
jgi:hypothetical protein